MKEYKVMILMDSGWRKKSGVNCSKQPVFKSYDDALTWAEKIKEYHMKRYQTGYSNGWLVGREYKIMSREVTEWEDVQ